MICPMCLVRKLKGYQGNFARFNLDLLEAHPAPRETTPLGVFGVGVFDVFSTS